MQWSTACPDWESRIASGRSIIPDGLPINEERAAKALRIFKRLKVTDIPGQPTIGDVFPEWIFALVRVVFGAYDGETKRQLIREFFVLIAKKNIKSTTAAGIMLTALIVNERAMGEYLILAPSKDIADNSFLPAYGMVKADPALLARFKPSDTVREITNRLDGSSLSVKSADADVVGGVKATSFFVDELWLFGKKSQAANVLSELSGAHASKPEGFGIFASTQSDEPPAGVFRQKLIYHRSVRDGVISDPTSLPLIYEYPDAMAKSQAWRDPKTWHIPNPSLGRSVDEVWLGTELKKRELEGASQLALFISKHFNIEAGIGLKSDVWVGAEFWRVNPRTGVSNIDPTLDFDELLRRSEVVVFGIDGGGLDDLLGAAAIGIERDTGRFLLWNRAWAHRIVLDRRKEIAPRLIDLEAAGDLVIVESPGDDVEELSDYIERADRAGLLAEEDAIGVDSFGVAAIKRAVTARGIDESRIVGIPQGWQLNGAIKTAERELAGNNLIHAGTALMDFVVGNARVEARGNAVAIEKQKSGSAKIDPLMATFNGVVLAGRGPQPIGTAEILAI